MPSLSRRGYCNPFRLHFELGIFGRRAEAEGCLEGFVQPGQTGQEEDGKVEEGLVSDHELDEGESLPSARSSR